jgi:S-formylglutathione hydrolase FrmB
MGIAGCHGPAPNPRPQAAEEASDLPATASPLVLVADTPLSPRLHELTLRSPSLAADTRLRILLPAGYDAASDRRYPVLYLLHGCCDVDPSGYAAWTTLTDVEPFTAKMPLLIVMPEAGSGGLYSDPYNDGKGGGNRWETYHIRELLPWIESHYRVRRRRAGRMLAGLSMGGGGAFVYAARYPDLFASAAAYSAMLDTNTPRGQDEVYAIEDGAHEPHGATWGPRATEEVRWRGHNAYDLAENLAPLKLFIRTGDGRSGAAPVDQVESLVDEMAHNLHDELSRLHIAHAFLDYGAGTHTWPYWQDDLHATVPAQLAYALSEPPPPQRISYRSIAPSFTVFGWRVAMQREVVEFVRLGNASRSGFTLSGSGIGEVTTPAYYRSGARCTVSIDGRALPLTADAQGRLSVPVDLGPSRSIQEFRPGSPAGYLKTVTVSIAEPGA